MKRFITNALSLARNLVQQLSPSLAKAIRCRLNAYNERNHWDKRIQDVLDCPDNARLPRVANAGSIIGDFQVMHNGIEVVASGYYGDGITRMLASNQGCHEPQEEVLFETIVQSLPEEAVMIEVGAYWAFYSIWFCKIVSNAKAYLIEPEKANLDIGMRNFAHNNCQGSFSRGYVGSHSGKTDDDVNIIALDNFAAENDLDHIHLLHADVQAFEMQMLAGCKRLLSTYAIDYLFISTHSMPLHAQCIHELEHYGYRILASVDLEETYSLDGILVACSPRVTPPALIPPSKK